MSGLPYEGTPPPDERRVDDPLDRPLVDQPYTEPSALDRALDDYEAPASRREVPEHVQSLMGRMSKGKVYLLEESPAMVMLDDGERVRSDPRLAALAEQLDTQDPTTWLEAVSAGAPSPILHHVLWVQSDLIKHLSTSKVFSWATGLGAGVMGIEWLNDTTLELLFSTPAAALLGLSLLSKAGFDPGEGDDPLLERAAHRFPISLLPTESKQGVELLSGSGAGGGDGEIKRKGRGGFGGSMTADIADVGAGGSNAEKAREKEVEEWNIAQGIDPHARIAIRYATEADKQLRQQAKQSEWYKRHGRAAGKERASEPRRFDRDDGGAGGRVSFRDREAAEGGREFAKRIGRGREQRRSGPYDRPRHRNADDLDRELENMARRRQGEEVMDDDVDMDAGPTERRGGGGGGGRRRGGGGGGGGRERRGVEDLDKELDDLFAARTADR